VNSVTAILHNPWLHVNKEYKLTGTEIMSVQDMAQKLSYLCMHFHKFILLCSNLTVQILISKRRATVRSAGLKSV